MLVVKNQAPLKAKRTAFPYQVETVEAIKSLTYAAIFHEQGLGKTKIAIDLALTWVADGELDSVIIVTKKMLVRNWEEEVVTHSHLRARVLDREPRALFYAFNSAARIYITHYEMLISAEKAFALFLKTRRVGVICDESQKFKNPHSSVARCLNALASGFKRRVIMTGTPIANRPYDIWSQIYFLDQGASLGTDFKTFRNLHDLPPSTASKQAVADSLATINKQIKNFTVRKTKVSSGITLPTKVIADECVEMEQRQRVLYENVRKDLRVSVVQSGEIVIDDAEAILKRLLRLVQIASNPRMIDESYRNIPGKIPKLREILQKATKDSGKAIVWTSFTENADWLAKQLAEYRPRRVHGKLAMADRNSAIEAFKRDAACKVLVATPGAAKEGLTLTVANTAIFYDRSFSLDDYLQSQDRIHRISQTRSCFVFNLIAKDSIDNWVNDLLAAKHLSAQLGQGDISKAAFKESMTTDLQQLLGSLLNNNSQ